ncbi:hypothetical protein [Roseateles sp. MS654]|uniref:hypothetical protein n=1 Tax=Roseateles sp. MS654 TaxID=3412685 RepID=UPI003C2D669F
MAQNLTSVAGVASPRSGATEVSIGAAMTGAVATGAALMPPMPLLTALSWPAFCTVLFSACVAPIVRR